MNALLKLSSLRIGYRGRPLTDPLSFEIPTGARLGIIGGNGSGKSTLVKTLLGLIPPLSGSYRWQAHASFGYVPQEHQVDPLFPLSVRDLLKMGAYPELPRLRPTSTQFERAASELLELFEIQALAASPFRELSGGQRQRVLIARALFSHPNVLVMDEPHNSLDYSFREKLWKVLDEFQKKKALVWIVIDHDLNRILHRIDWLCLMGTQKVVFGPLEEVLTPSVLTEALGEPVHVHKENGRFQVHFL